MSKTPVTLREAGGFTTEHMPYRRPMLEPFWTNLPDGDTQIHEATGCSSISIPLDTGEECGLVLSQRPGAGQPGQGIAFFLTAPAMRSLAAKMFELADLVDGGAGKQ